VSDFIRIKKWPADHAQEAYEAGYYIEALQTLHGWMEVKLRELLHLQRVGTPSEDKHNEWSKAWNMTNELPLNHIARALFVMGALSEDILNKILSFNRVRNNLIHKLFHEPYEKEYLGIPKEDYDAAFRAGIDLGYVINSMSEEKIK
jgi:hypothetical protein